MLKTNVRRSMLVGAAISLLGVAGLYLGFASLAHGQWRNVVTADRYDLVDFRGVARARLGLSGGEQQFTYLYLMDSDGRNRIEHEKASELNATAAPPWPERAHRAQTQVRDTIAPHPRAG